MSELIPIQDNGGVQAVMGRDLHAFLEVQSNYTTWINRLIEKYGFVEGQDFIPKMEESSGGRPSENHILTMDMAKEISMVQNNAKGREARQYFIECEKRYQAGEMSELDEAKLVQKALQITYRQVRELEAVNAEMQPKANYFDEFVADEDLIQFRTLANQLEIKESALRQILIDHKWIYRVEGKRWSNKRNRIVNVYQYRAYAEKKPLFRLVPCHEAPRINGEVQQSLKLTPRGAEAVTTAVKKWLRGPSVEKKSA